MAPQDFAAVGMEALSNAVVRTIREPLLILDADLRILAANPAFFRTFRIERDDAVGHCLFDLHRGQWDVPALRRLLEDVLPTDAAVEDFPVEHDFPGLGRRSMVLNARRLERDGQPLLLLAIQDVSEQVHARLELERSNQELERFAYVASHDLQEPLRMVASYTQLLARRYEGRLDERADRYIHYAVEGAERMKALINDLLAYSRVSTQGAELVSIDADQALQEVLRDLRMRIRSTGATVTADPLPRVVADPVQLRQVFQNLLANALKFAGDAPPRVHVSGRVEGGSAVVTVRDEGIGVDPAYFERIFVIFQRLHGREKEGTGIGLALCKRIIERHGGRLWIDSEPGRGSAFHFTLPHGED